MSRRTITNNQYKVVTRRYTKKSGELVVKQYTYKISDNGLERIKADKGYFANTNKKFVHKNGRETEYLQQYRLDIQNDKNLTDLQKEKMTKELDTWVSNAKLSGKSLTQSNFESHYIGLEGNKISRYIYNMGGDIDEVAEDMGVDPSVLLKESNWKFTDDEGNKLDKPIFNYAGTDYIFTFDYNSGGIRWQLVR